MSRPESVSSSTAIFGFSIAICRISTRFFSPPENPSLRYLDASSRGTFNSSIAANRLVRNSGIGTGSSSPPLAALRFALIALRRKLVTVTPGIACGYWKARKRPRCARSSAPSWVRSSPSKRIWPSVTSYAGWPMRAYASVDFPEPLGPMIACFCPRSTSRSTPLTISVPSSSATCRFLISSCAMRRDNLRKLVTADGTARLAHGSPRPSSDRRRANCCKEGSLSSPRRVLRCAHALRHLTSRAAHPARRPPPGVRSQAPPRDGPVARQGDARVQGRRERDRLGAGADHADADEGRALVPRLRARCADGAG